MNAKNTLWQSRQWELFQEQCANTTLRIDNVLIIERQTILGKKFFEIPRVEVSALSQSFWNTLEQKAQEKGIIFTRIFPADSPEFVPKKQTQSAPEIFPKHTLILDLSVSEEEILTQMKQKGRYNIRLAEKKGVSTAHSDNVDAFCKLLDQTTQRDGFSAHPKEVYETMLKSFGENALLLLAEHQGHIIAGGIFLFSQNICTYYYGASGNEYRNIMAPYLLQWTAIKEAKNRGCNWFDFLGVAPRNDANHQLSGVSQFKEKFGGIRHTYAPGFEIVYDKKWYTLLNLMKKIRNILS